MSSYTPHQLSSQEKVRIADMLIKNSTLTSTSTSTPLLLSVNDKLRTAEILMANAQQQMNTIHTENPRLPTPGPLPTPTYSSPPPTNAGGVWVPLAPSPPSLQSLALTQLSSKCDFRPPKTVERPAEVKSQKPKEEENPAQLPSKFGFRPPKTVVRPFEVKSQKPKEDEVEERPVEEKSRKRSREISNEEEQIPVEAKRGKLLGTIPIATRVNPNEPIMWKSLPPMPMMRLPRTQHYQCPECREIQSKLPSTEFSNGKIFSTLVTCKRDTAINNIWAKMTEEKKK